MFDPDIQPLSDVDGTDGNCFREPPLHLGRHEGGRRSRGTWMKTPIEGGLSSVERPTYCYMRVQYIDNTAKFNAVGSSCIRSWSLEKT